MNWSEEFSNAVKVEIFSCHNDFFIEHYKSSIHEILKNNGEIIFYLPDYGDENIIQELNRRHNKTDFRGRITHAKKLMERNFSGHSKQISIKYYRNTLCTVYYIVHKRKKVTVFFMPYRNSINPEVKYPVIKVNGKGELYKKYIQKDLEYLNLYDYPSIH